MIKQVLRTKRIIFDETENRYKKITKNCWDITADKVFFGVMNPIRLFERLGGSLGNWFASQLTIGRAS